MARTELEAKRAQGREPGTASWLRTDAQQAEALQAQVSDLTAELERYRAALKRICTGQALDPHMSHDPVALSECPVAYCIARQALQEPSGD